MGVLDIASGDSDWRGLEYYKNKKVIKLEKINEVKYKGLVKGTKEYETILNILIKCQKET